MSFPRRVVPDACYLITRRASLRTFRLRPHPHTNQIMAYCAAWAAEKTGLLLHAYVVMSNHHHLVVSDPKGVMPIFLQELHRSTAKALNASQGLWGNLWATEPCSAVRLPTLDDVLDKIAYCAANPVAAALVKSPQEWPGVNLWLPGERKRIRRPGAYFDPAGEMPESVELRIEAPTEAGGLEEWRGRVREAVEGKVEQARESVATQGLGFVGANAVMKKSFLQRAKSYEAKRQVNPVLAAKDVRVRKTYLRIEKAFRVAYRVALELWTTGEREVVFPYGTWWMGVHHRAEVMPAPG